MKTKNLLIGPVLGFIFLAGCETTGSSSKSVVTDSYVIPAQPNRKPPFQELLESTEKNRAAYVAAHPDLAADVKAALLKGEFLPGMTKTMIESCYGAPKLIEDGHGQDKKDTWWYYFGTTLIFRDNALIRAVTS